MEGLPLTSQRLTELADEVVYMPPGELYRLRNEYEERLAKQKQLLTRAEEELEQSAAAIAERELMRPLKRLHDADRPRRTHVPPAGEAAGSGRLEREHVGVVRCGLLESIGLGILHRLQASVGLSQAAPAEFRS